MAKRGALAVLQEEINNNDDWARVMGKPGILGKKKSHQYKNNKIIKQFIFISDSLLIIC